MEYDCSKYRESNESDTEWEYRKRFLETLLSKFNNVNRLICLSKIYANIEFLKCCYPPLVMQEVKDLTDNYLLNNIQNNKENQVIDSPIKILHLNELTNDTSITFEKGIDWLNGHISNEHFVMFYENNHVKLFRPNHIISQSSFSNYIKSVNPRFSIIRYSSTTSLHPIIEASFALNKIKHTFTFKKLPYSQIHCTLVIGENFRWESIGQSRMHAKSQVALQLLNILQDFSYIIMEKTCETTSDITFETVKAVSSKQDSKPPKDIHKTGIDEHNKGLQLLSKLGWSGGDVGKKRDVLQTNSKNSQEILDEILTSQGVKTFGQRCHVFNPQNFKKNEYDEEREFPKDIRTFLWRYKLSKNLDTLFFNHEFTINQREVIHMMARKFNFQTKSFGKGEHRRLLLKPYLNFLDFLYVIVDKFEIPEANPNSEYIKQPPSLPASPSGEPILPLPTNFKLKRSAYKFHMDNSEKCKGKRKFAATPPQQVPQCVISIKKKSEKKKIRKNTTQECP